MTGRSVRTLAALVVAGGLGLALAGVLPWVAIELDAAGGPFRLTQYGFQNPYGILPVIGGAHEEALKEMKGRWKRPVSGLKWYRQVQRDFAALPSQASSAS